MRSFRTKCFLLLTILLSSCLGSKYLEPGQRILTKQKIKGAKRFDQEQVYSLLAQEPNTRFFGLPIALEVHLFEWGKRGYDTAKYRRRIRKIQEKYARRVNKTDRITKKTRLISSRDKKVSRWTRKIREGNWRMRQGQPLAVYDSILHAVTREKLKSYLANEGYFEAKAHLNTTRRGKKRIKTSYRLSLGTRYYIDSVQYSFGDDSIKSLINENPKDALTKKDAYSQDNLANERDRIFDILANNGYYNFSKQYIYFEVDTFSLPKPRVLVKINVTQPPNDGMHERYVIDSVSFVGESDINSSVNSSEVFQGVTFKFGKSKYNKELINSRLFIRKNQLYSRKDELETQRQLANLDAFKFININYDTTGGKFLASVFTSPVDKYQTSNEVGLSSTAGLPGPFVNVSLKNRNVFSRLELLELTGNLNLQGIGNIANEERNYSLLQYGGAATLTFPQFLFPLSNRLKQKVSRYNPRTNLTFSYNFEDRFQEYERQTFNSSFSYQWQIRDDYNYTITPIGFSLVDSNIEPRSQFDSLLILLRANGNGSYPASFESALLTTASFDAIISDNYGDRQGNSSFYHLYFESGGNFLSTIAKPLFNIDSIQYQYLKFRVDHRRQLYIDRNTVIATRLHVGVALPYGSGTSSALPYEKYFYIGGSNSIRAWPARRLGPGDFSIFGNNSETGPRVIDYTLEQGGDIIVESSIELRRRMTNFLSWAFFIDAGNIWQIRSVPLQPFEDQLFTSGKSGLFQVDSFVRELAVGTGLGLRIDFGYLVFRVDGAAQVFDPAQPGGARFVFDNIDFLSAFQRPGTPGTRQADELEARKRFLRNKTRVNIGIGFPF